MFSRITNIYKTARYSAGQFLKKLLGPKTNLNNIVEIHL